MRHFSGTGATTRRAFYLAARSEHDFQPDSIGADRLHRYGCLGSSRSERFAFSRAPTRRRAVGADANGTRRSERAGSAGLINLPASVPGSASFAAGRVD